MLGVCLRAKEIVTSALNAPVPFFAPLMPRPSPTEALHGTSKRDQLYHLLRRGHVLTKSEAAAKLDCNKRHVQRLVADLEAADVAVERRMRGRERVYALPVEDQQAARVEVDVSERESLALMIAAVANRRDGDRSPLPKALRRVLDQIVTALPEAVTTFEPGEIARHLHFEDAETVDVAPDHVMTLIHAIGNRQRVAIDYHAAYKDKWYTGRVIEPWGLARRSDTWLCVARDPEKPAGKDMRDFNLVRIERIVAADPDSNGGDYAIPEDFDLDLYFSDRFDTLAGDTVYEVHLLFEETCVPYVRSKRYQRTQQIHEEEREDGRLVVSYEVAGLKEMTSFVRSWGPGVTVLQPPELRERIRADAEAVAARYADNENDSAVQHRGAGGKNTTPDI